jgi:hypothetical protein
MSGRMNWKAANDRRRVREQGAETVGGQMHGTAPAPRVVHTPNALPKVRSFSEPEKIDSFWANRAHDAIVVTFSTFKNHNLVDVRKHGTNGAGQLVPTPKGVALKIARLPDLAKAIDKALRRARELGLLEGEGEQ